MSGPVPSPSMNGMIGSSGTVSCPWRWVIAVPDGGVSEDELDMSDDAVRSGPPEEVARFAQKLWKSLWKRSDVYRVVTHPLECFCRLHYSRAVGNWSLVLGAWSLVRKTSGLYCRGLLVNE